MRRYALLAAALGLAMAPALAAPPAAKKPAKPKPAQTLKATVVSVSGPAQRLVIGEGKKKYQPLKAGDELGPLTVIRTGLGAKVVLKFEDRGKFTINNATKIGIAELRKKGDLATARLGLKYGTLRASVEGGRGRNDFRIATPVATLSVRGSEADVGSMGDSTNLLDADSGDWTVGQDKVVNPGDGTTPPTTTPGTRTVTGGEKATTGNQMPIIILVQDLVGDSTVTDSFGTTGSENQSLGNNNTGQRGTGPPQQKDEGTSSTEDFVPKPVVPADEPGWP